MHHRLRHHRLRHHRLRHRVGKPAGDHRPTEARKAREVATCVPKKADVELGGSCSQRAVGRRTVATKEPIRRILWRIDDHHVGFRQKLKKEPSILRRGAQIGETVNKRGSTFSVVISPGAPCPCMVRSRAVDGSYGSPRHIETSKRSARVAPPRSDRCGRSPPAARINQKLARQRKPAEEAPSSAIELLSPPLKLPACGPK